MRTCIEDTYAVEYLAEGVNLRESYNLKALIEELQVHLNKAPLAYKNFVDVWFFGDNEEDISFDIVYKRELTDEEKSEQSRDTDDLIMKLKEERRQQYLKLKEEFGG